MAEQEDNITPLVERLSKIKKTKKTLFVFILIFFILFYRISPYDFYVSLLLILTIGSLSVLGVIQYFIKVEEGIFHKIARYDSRISK